MRFLYFYSPLYQFYHEHFQEILSPYFKLEPNLIEDVVELNGFHHFAGLTIKLDLIIDAITRYMGETIIFSDATLFINKKNSHEIKDYFLQYKENDIVFIHEEGNGQNIGIIQINCSEKTLEFFNRSLDKMKKKIEVHDQCAIKNTIFNDCEDLNLKFAYFGERIVCDRYYHWMRDSFLIWKSFINNKHNKIANYNHRIQQFYDNELIDTETYNKWIKHV